MTQRKQLAPICLFVFNRIEHTVLTVESLKKNIHASDSDLFIFSDAPKKNNSEEIVSKVRSYIKTITGFKSVTIIERKVNFGLSKSIIDGVAYVLKLRNKIIVLEDDMLTSKFFLTFMNEGLDFYENETSVASIHGYSIPGSFETNTFFLKGSDCWGWATWHDRWAIFQADGKKLYEELSQKKLLKEFNYKSNGFFSGMLLDQIKGNNDSWAIRWYASTFLQNKVTLYPKYSLINNIGNDGSGIHCANNNSAEVELWQQHIPIKNKDIFESKRARKIYESYFKKLNGGFIQGIKYNTPNHLKILIKKLINK